MSSEYKDLLKTAPWQALRLKILARDKWTCRFCYNSALNGFNELDSNCEISFHVHHTHYKRGLKPWEYPENSLITLCSDCHAKEEQKLPDSSGFLISALKQAGFTASDFEQLAIAAGSLPIRVCPDTPTSHAEILSWVCKNINIFLPAYNEYWEGDSNDIRRLLLTFPKEDKKNGSPN